MKREPWHAFSAVLHGGLLLAAVIAIALTVFHGYRMTTAGIEAAARWNTPATAITDGGSPAIWAMVALLAVPIAAYGAALIGYIRIRLRAYAIMTLAQLVILTAVAVGIV